MSESIHSSYRHYTSILAIHSFPTDCVSTGCWSDVCSARLFCSDADDSKRSHCDCRQTGDFLNFPAFPKSSSEYRKLWQFRIAMVIRTNHLENLFNGLKIKSLQFYYLLYSKLVRYCIRSLTDHELSLFIHFFRIKEMVFLLFQYYISFSNN